MTDAPRFTAGPNIALKLPERLYAQTLAFYRDVLGLPVTSDREDGAAVAFGGFTLHLDRVPGQSQPDLWLQLRSDDTAAARDHLTAHGIHPCNEVEALPEGFDAFWIASPSGTIHLVAKTPEADG